jgi:hypothetical protein
VQSYATLVHNSRSSRPEVIVSVNYALRYTFLLPSYAEVISKIRLLFSSDIEAKHLQLSTGQLEKSFGEYYSRGSTQLPTTSSLTSSIDHDKCSSSNTSLNSTFSSTSGSSISSNRSYAKVSKGNRTLKQSKVSPMKTNVSSTTIDDYPATNAYQQDDYYYPLNTSSSTTGAYSNLAFYTANYSSSPSCASNVDQSMYYDIQDKKRFRSDNEHQHLPSIDYESNGSYEKMNFYSTPSTTTGNCYVNNNGYPTDHSYHHASVIVDSQQYFLNGWNGTAAF